MLPPSTSLCIVDDSTFWPWNRWPEFARWSNPDRCLIVIPIAGFADWGLGHPLDSEEVVLSHLMRAASLQKPRELQMLVLPVLRFVVGSDPGCCFTLKAPEAHAFISEVVASVESAGFRRVLLLNASPWNEEVCDVAARDLRIARGLQMFCVNLAALNLDFHPSRSESRRNLQTLLTFLLGEEPLSGDAAKSFAANRGIAAGPEEVNPIEGNPVSLADAQEEGEALLNSCGARLLSLLIEIHARAPLPNKGALTAMVSL